MSTPTSPHLLLIPFKDAGHIAPTMILANKLLLEGLTITILCVQPEAHSIISNSGTTLNLKLLQTQESDQEENLESLLNSLKLSDPAPTAVLVDVILSWTRIPIQRSGIPRYVLYTASCTNLSAMFGLKPKIRIDASERERPDRKRDRKHRDDRNQSEDLFEARAVLVNSALELESGELELIRSSTKKPILPVGPLLDLAEESKPHSCISWLDQQMPRSVIFIAFGSRTYLSDEQIQEIASGLERSKQPFLWLLPVPPDASEDSYLGSVLGEGFRGKSSGMIVTDWAPQKMILKHKSVAAFVTHCGWNSVLECLCLGAKPLLCLPFKADQPVNCRFIVDELRVGLELERDELGVARGEEIEKKIRAVVGDEGKRMTGVLQELIESLNGALQGSSMENVKGFAKEISQLGKNSI